LKFFLQALIFYFLPKRDWKKFTGRSLKKSRSPSIPPQNFPPGPVLKSANAGVPLAGAVTPTGGGCAPA